MNELVPMNYSDPGMKGTSSWFLKGLVPQDLFRDRECDRYRIICDGDGSASARSPMVGRSGECQPYVIGSGPRGTKLNKRLVYVRMDRTSAMDARQEWGVPAVCRMLSDPDLKELEELNKRLVYVWISQRD